MKKKILIKLAIMNNGLSPKKKDMCDVNLWDEILTYF